MTIPAFLKPENGPLGRAFAAWLDQAPQGLASRFVVLWFVILYTAFALISSASIGLSPAMLKTYAQGLHPTTVYAAPGPLAPLIAGAWFRLVTPTDWAFHLLAVVNAAAGLFAADRIARLYLSGDKQIAVLLLLLLTPFYQFMGQEFGANEIMLSTWPIATWCFLRAFATRHVAWSAAAGATAALAVLGNDLSVFLIVGFAVAVLAHPGRGTFLRSSAPWLMAAAGAVVLTPYAERAIAALLAGEHTGLEIPGFTAGTALSDPFWHSVLIVVGVGTVIAVWGIVVRPTLATLRDTVWPPDPDGRMLVILLVVPLAALLVTGPIAGGALVPPWLAAGWFLLPVILLRPKTAGLSRGAAIRIAALVAVTTIGALATAPWIAWRRHSEGTAEAREYYQLVAAEVTRAWRLATARALPVVAGDPALASAVAFYSPDHPDPWLGFEAGSAGSADASQRLSDRDGFVVICRADDESCVDTAKQRTAGKVNVEYMTYSTTSRYLGKSGPLGRFFFIIVPAGSKPVINLPAPRGAPQ
jgi:hypothetical protein